MDAWTIVGTVASLIGLALGLWVLSVAVDAKTAAQETRAWARKKSLSEELQQAQQHVEQIGDFLHKKEWMAVRIRAQEVSGSRWRPKINLLQVCVVNNAVVGKPGPIVYLSLTDANELELLSKDYDTQDVEQLYEFVRRKALDVDSAIDEILKDQKS
jgi:hypothetical protein